MSSLRSIRRPAWRRAVPSGGSVVGEIAARSPGGPLLRVDGLSVTYGPVSAVRDLELEVRQGEIVALLGANGAGKTSTLGAIMGLVRSSARAILFDGHDVRRAEPERRVRLGMTLTPEGRQIFSELTIEENLRLGRAALGRHRANKDGDDAELLDLFPILRERRGRLAGTLSGGQQQQLAIARSLMSHPRLLLLDEPSLGLAPVVVDTVFDLITTLAGRGITILLVEQNVTLALSVASRGYVLDTGRLVLSGTSAELMALEDEMMRSYLGLGMTSAQGSTR